MTTGKPPEPELKSGERPNKKPAFAGFLLLT